MLIFLRKDIFKYQQLSKEVTIKIWETTKALKFAYGSLPWKYIQIFGQPYTRGA